MQREEFSEIVKKANLHAIAKALKRSGYKNCKLNLRLKKASLADIVRADYIETPSFADSKGNEYSGSLFLSPKGYENYEFAIVEMLSHVKPDLMFTKKMLIYAKEQ